MRRLVYSSAEKRTPKQQAKTNYFLQQQKVKRMTKEIKEMIVTLDEEKAKLDELEKIYKSY